MGTEKRKRKKSFFFSKFGRTERSSEQKNWSCREKEPDEEGQRNAFKIELKEFNREQEKFNY